jgi:Flp pilus assembly protein TadD
VRVEREAIGLLESDEDKKPCADRLKLYESGSPYRDPELAAEPAPSAALEAFTRRAGGVLRAQHGRFAEAAADFARVIELHPEDHEVWHWQAVTLVQRGQLDAYREFRHQSVEFFQKTNDPNTAERISKDFLMLPCSGPDLETAARLADTAANAPTNHPDITWFQFTKGLGEYRQGRFTSAVEWMQKVLATSPHDPNRDAEASMVLAMSQYQQKQTEEAYATLAKGIRIADKKSPTLESGNLGDGWVDWIIARALMAEARALIPLPSATTVLSR